MYTHELHVNIAKMYEYKLNPVTRISQNGSVRSIHVNFDSLGFCLKYQILVSKILKV